MKFIFCEHCRHRLLSLIYTPRFIGTTQQFDSRTARQLLLHQLVGQEVIR